MRGAAVLAVVKPANKTAHASCRNCPSGDFDWGDVLGRFAREVALEMVDDLQRDRVRQVRDLEATL